MGQASPFGFREPIAKLGNSREKAQKPQEKLSFSDFLRVLSLFAANFVIVFRISDFGLPSDFGFRISEF
jgi:hypothetical protein